MLGVVISGPAQSAALSLSQVPSVTSFKSLSPNIIFMLDDSGSMQWEFLGNRVNGYSYGFPHGSQVVYGSANYSDQLPDFSANNKYAANYRNSFTNPNYYDPAITYTPWACPASYPESQSNPPTFTPSVGACEWDSTKKMWLWPDADVSKAYQNPNDTGKGFRSLDVWNDSSNINSNTSNNGFAGRNNYYSGGGPTYWYTKNGWVQGNRPFWPATYFNYFGPRPGSSSDWYSLSNFSRVEICPQTLSANSNGNVGSCTLPPSLPATPVAYHTYINASGDYVYVETGGSQIVRTPAEELQNFANWYQYYRSHILLARAGTSLAFMGLPEGFRVDYSLLNPMASGGTPQYSTTDTFGNSQRDDFLSRLFQTPIAQNGTPSRYALAGVGNWLSQAPGASAPWGTSAAEKNANNGAEYLSCRQNYLVFVTDGEWNGGGPNVGNVDNTQGPSLTDSTGQNTYQYSPSTPYKDGYSNTFADVAFQYWEHDLQSGLVNDVPTNNADPAFWQHLVTFDVGLGVTPSLVTQYQNSTAGAGTSTTAAQAAVLAAITAGTTQWPNGSSYQIDDLWHGGVNGHGGFLSANDPTEFAAALKNTLLSIVNRTASSSSVAVNTQKGQEVRTETQVYQPLYHPQNWWGELLADPIVINGTTGEPEVSSTPAWNASCSLTGISGVGDACATPGNSVFTGPSSRTILTWRTGTGGVPFEWLSLSSAQQSALGSKNVLDYLRGVRSDEIGQSGGTLRARTSVLGDIVDSSPKWVGYPNAVYPSTNGQNASWADALYTGSSMPENSAAQTYEQFATSEQTRSNIVYVGANDGMLHGFRAGHYALSNGQLVYVGSDNDGKEVLAYMPSAVLDIANQYSDPNYNHHYFVDATPGTGDLYYAGAWHTWLVSGIGGGGKDLFALDITNPSQFSESNAASIVKADWTPSNLTCINVSSCGNDLGNTYGTPIIRRFHNGDWGVIWGNGLNSTNGGAGIYIGLLDHSTGAWKIYYLATGYGPSNDPAGQSRSDGIMYATSADLDGDHVVDYVYAGDYFGNVWRFNLTSSNPSDWHVSTYGNGTASPLFSAVNDNGTAQPITTKLQLVTVPDASTGKKRLLVEFGTGSAVLAGDSTPDSTAAGVQSLYGIWDWDLGQWNSGYTTASNVTVPAASVQYNSLARTQPTITRSTLQQQTILSELDDSGNTYTGSGTGHRVVSNNSVCWKGSTASCTSGTSNAYGWYLDLISSRPGVGNNGMQGEKLVYNPTIENGVLIFNTTINAGNLGLTCNPIANSGWTMALDPATGGRLGFEVFYNSSGQLVSLPNVSTVTSGITYGAVGTASFIVYNGQKYMVVSTATGQTKLVKVNLGGGIASGRLTWVELR